MAYRFKDDESVRSAVLRCAREQLDRAVFELGNEAGRDRARAVHNARKAIKKQRSLLRLSRGAMPREQRRSENAALRAAGRGLSGTRDADVMVASMDQLSERFAGQVPASDFQTVRAYLEARRSAGLGHGNGSVADSRVVQGLTAAHARVNEWQLRTGGWKALESGLLLSYERGRKAFAHVRVDARDADLHAWRKRAKDLWYHERLLAPTCGPTVRGHAKDLDRLSDLLGDDHDLAVLRHALTHGDPPVPADLDAVINLIDHRREELQTEAIHIGERVYAEKPKAFRRRMRSSWKAGRALARAPQEQHPAQLAAATR